MQTVVHAMAKSILPDSQGVCTQSSSPLRSPDPAFALLAPSYKVLCPTWSLRNTGSGSLVHPSAVPDYGLQGGDTWGHPLQCCMFVKAMETYYPSATQRNHSNSELLLQKFSRAPILLLYLSASNCIPIDSCVLSPT